MHPIKFNKMRPVERIIPYLDLLKERSINISEIDEKLTYNNIIISDDVYEELKKVWLDNPDWRFTQLLVNTGIIPNFPGMWYYTEDLDVMLNLGFKPREVILWGTYGKNLDQPLKMVFLKNMSNEHIKAILQNVKSISNRYKESFENELKYREENNIIIEDEK